MKIVAKVMTPAAPSFSLHRTSWSHAPSIRSGSVIHSENTQDANDGSVEVLGLQLIVAFFFVLFSTLQVFYSALVLL